MALGPVSPAPPGCVRPARTAARDVAWHAVIAGAQVSRYAAFTVSCVWSSIMSLLNMKSL